MIVYHILTNCDINFDGTIVTYTDDTCLLFSHKTWDGV